MLGDSATLDALRQNRILAELPLEDLRRVAAAMEQVDAAPGAVLVQEGDSGRELFFILAGEATVARGHVGLYPIGVGAEFGSLGLLTGRPRAASVIASTPMTLGRLTLERWNALAASHPATALLVMGALFSQVRDELVEMTDTVASLMRGRSLPRAREVAVHLKGQSLQVRTGTLLRELLPETLDGEPVVGALLGQKPVALNTPLLSEATVAPLNLSHPEGRAIYVRSLGLLLLEAARQVDPAINVWLGPGRGDWQLVEVRDAAGRDKESLARSLAEAMEALAKSGAHIRSEHWTVDEASHFFQGQGWDCAARYLRTARQATVRLISCGKVYALSQGPVLADTAALRGFWLSPHEDGLLLHLGVNGNGKGSEPPPEAGMAADHRRWLSAMGVTSVGAFNELCISGQVKDLIRVAEGFQEKQIGRIADSVAASRDRLRIIAIAGPSSSGKTTFIKRLTVQLQINGMNPIGLSLDDYYVDRERTVRDEKGEYDFEALEALDLSLLQDHVRRLLAGETVRLAHYDFKTGKSHPAGGALLSLKPGDVLMMEGIHGLNPKLLGDIPREGQMFRVFVHPATMLSFDRLSRVNPADLRLLRRIVRDRHGRGYGAADSIARWASVQAGERKHIFPHQGRADVVFDTSLIYEPAVLKVYAERYLLEVPPDHPSYATAYRLRHLVDRFVAIYPDHVPPTSLIREFIGGSGFEY